MHFLYRDETKELNECTRQGAGGSFIHLADGSTHYELSNPGAEETVVLVHGFSVPYFIYDLTFRFLTQEGFRVLRYDLLGRGYSDRPDARYDIDLFLRQIRDLLDALDLTRPVCLVGLSMGGPITAAFTAFYPERVDRLVLIDPVGAEPFALGRVLKALAAPGLGEILVSVLGSAQLVKRIASSALDREHIGEYGPRYLAQMQFRGFKRALLSSIRNNMLGSFRGVYEQVGKMGKPVLLFWGRHDRTVPIRHSAALRAAIPQVQFHVIESAEHIPHSEAPEEVNPILLRFLQGEQGPADP